MSPRIQQQPIGYAAVKVRDVLRLLADDGWYHVRTVGSHRQLKHAVKPGKVTVAGHPSAELQPGTLKSILRQAGLADGER